MSASTDSHGSETKTALAKGLSAVGFIALLLFGIFLAIYAASYVPQTLSRLSAAVFLTGNEPENGTPEETETPVVNEEPTQEEETPATPTTPTTPTTPSTPTTGGPLYVPQAPTVTYYTNQPRLYGLPDLAIVNVQTGYMRGSTFVDEDDEIPDNRDAAVRFIVQNLGTNVTSNWRVHVDVTGEDDAYGVGGLLYPNGTQLFTLVIEDPEDGERLTVDIEVDYDNRIAETNENNNDERARIEVED